jgi:hypothetical protein
VERGKECTLILLNSKNAFRHKRLEGLNFNKKQVEMV